jgi:uncharacterized protein (DUF169 family)
MDAIKMFQEYFGVRGVGVKFYTGGIDTSSFDFLKLKDAKFCQAVKLARNHQILLDRDSIACKGARYALGFEQGVKEDLVDAIQLKREVSREIAEQLVDNIPRIENSLYTHIGLNVDDPDIFIFYTVPKVFMEILKVYQRNGNNLEVNLSSITAMCGNVAVQTYLTKKICISFGCNDSRKYGGVADEELIVGIPKEGIKQLNEIHWVFAR